MISAGGGGLSPPSVQEAEPGDLIPEVTQPSGVVQQAEHSLTKGSTTMAASKPSHQVSYLSGYLYSCWRIHAPSLDWTSSLVQVLHTCDTDADNYADIACRAMPL